MLPVFSSKSKTEVSINRDAPSTTGTFLLIGLPYLINIVCYCFENRTMMLKLIIRFQ